MKEQPRKSQEKHRLHPEVKLQVTGEELVFGPGIARLLELIEQTESVKESCAQMEMSYSKGWKIINRAEKELGYRLLGRHHGGQSGGSCLLTEEGKELLQKYRRLEEEVKKYTEIRFRDYFCT